MPPEEKMILTKKTMKDKKTKTILIVAGEASGDMHGASLVREMLRIDPFLNFYGIGGNKMQEAGVKLLVNASETAVVGLTEVISKLGIILKIMGMMMSKPITRQTAAELIPFFSPVIFRNHR